MQRSSFYYYITPTLVFVTFSQMPQIYILAFERATLFCTEKITHKNYSSVYLNS
jgi:hypothetical protein